MCIIYAEGCPSPKLKPKMPIPKDQILSTIFTIY